MEFLKLVKKRKTCYEFSDKSVSEKNLNKILEAGRWSPSCTNSQPWNFILVKDKNRISDVMETVNYGDFHSLPDKIIAVVLRAKLCRGENHSCFRGVDSGTYESYMSCGISAYSMALEASDLGIDSCLLTPEQKKIKKILNINKEDCVPILIGLGYEKKEAFQKKRERRDLKESLYYEKFRNDKSRKL